MRRGLEIKPVFLFLLLLVMPMVSWASDHCTDPDKYTIDKRCYVTNEQKKQAPYNAVVGLGSDHDFYCTGVVVKQDDGNLYLYTARHCVDKDDGSVEPKIWIAFQNGKETIVELVAAGDDSKVGDWAVYRFLPNYVKIGLFGKVRYQAIENIEDTIDYVYARNNVDFVRDFTGVGYGSLKIMSDEDIENFRQAYLDYLLKQEGITITDENGYIYGFHYGGVAVNRGLVQEFIKNSGYIGALFDYPSRLKFSNCYSMTDCQIWNGDSGSPLFDKENFVVALRVVGRSVIGGLEHAETREYTYTDDIYEGMKELKEVEPKVILIQDK